MKEIKSFSLSKRSSDSNFSFSFLEEIKSGGPFERKTEFLFISGPTSILLRTGPRYLFSLPEIYSLFLIDFLFIYNLNSLFQKIIN